VTDIVNDEEFAALDCGGLQSGGCGRVFKAGMFALGIGRPKTSQRGGANVPRTPVGCSPWSSREPTLRRIRQIILFAVGSLADLVLRG
jgi:hypothetical protein